MTGQITVQADPQLLRSTAQQAQALGSQLRQDFEGMFALTENTHYYWAGAAAEEYRQAFAEQRDGTEELLRLLSAFPEYLMKMAGVYEAAETRNTAQAESLPADFL